MCEYRIRTRNGRDTYFECMEDKVNTLDDNQPSQQRRRCTTFAGGYILGWKAKPGTNYERKSTSLFSGTAFTFTSQENDLTPSSLRDHARTQSARDLSWMSAVPVPLYRVGVDSCLLQTKHEHICPPYLNTSPRPSPLSLRPTKRRLL